MTEQDEIARFEAQPSLEELERRLAENAASAMDRVVADILGLPVVVYTFHPLTRRQRVARKLRARWNGAMWRLEVAWDSLRGKHDCDWY